MKRDGAVLDGGRTALPDEKASRPGLLNQRDAWIAPPPARSALFTWSITIRPRPNFDMGAEFRSE